MQCRCVTVLHAEDLLSFVLICVFKVGLWEQTGDIEEFAGGPSAE